ncbi:MAG TPA: collagen-binding domain-containing protein [Rhodothermales bacterium]|nr:collagen-binding domain-containing protein [Rhodothermales bacterium]
MKTSDFETHVAHRKNVDTRSLLALLVFFLVSIFALPTQAQPASPFLDCDGSARPIAFGSVSAFNFVTFDSYTGMNSDVEGLLAVGGDLNVQNYSVASGIAKPFSGNTLVVDGNLSWSNGQVFAGSGVYTGTATSQPNMLDGTLSKMGSSPISFSSVAASLTALSNSLAGRPANGDVVINSNNLSFNYNGSASAIIFNLTAAEFSEKNITFNVMSTAANPTVLVNVTGASVTWQYSGLSLGNVKKEYLLFNFPNATSLTASGIGIFGSILAPQATFYFDNGQVNGQVFVQNMDGSGESHHVPFCGDTETLLPVELTSFNATANGAEVLLRWTTASETNNAGFSVEMKQPVAADFTTLEFVDGHGTTELPQAYIFRLANLAPGTHTFRLKQIDYDGPFEYSPEVEVVIDMASAFSIEVPYPNPANPTAHFRFAVAREQAVRVELYDVRGRMVQRVYEGTPAAGQVQDLTIDGAVLPSGLYLVRVTGSTFTETRPLTFVK